MAVWHQHTRSINQLCPQVNVNVDKKKSPYVARNAYRRIAWWRCCSRRSCPPPWTPKAPPQACSRRSENHHEFGEMSAQFPRAKKRMDEPNTEFCTHGNSEIHGADYIPAHLRWLVQLLGETKGGREKKRSRALSKEDDEIDDEPGLTICEPRTPVAPES